MDVRIVDLDGAVVAQPGVGPAARITPARDWGPRIRLACSFRRFRRFEHALDERLPDSGPQIVLYGSGDFHHVSLALVRRLQQPCNLVVIDNHPDWMRGIPFLHCGTWLWHAARLPHVHRVFHLGGEVDFDNAYRLLAPRKMLCSGKIRVFPARRCFAHGWARLPQQRLRPQPDKPVSPERLFRLLEPFHRELADLPLYISLDKDVTVAADSVVNWDSGHLTLAEVCCLVNVLLRLSGGRLLGMDVVGDWSPVRTAGLFRRLFHWTMHPPLCVDPPAALHRNAEINRAILAEVFAGAATRKVAG